MATGTGKTVVMAMLIAWQTINKVMAPNDARFAKRFLIVTPGITIRDRLGVLHPEREDNYYRERDLVPVRSVGCARSRPRSQIVNYHAFLPRDAKEIQGVAANTRKLLRGGKPEDADAFRETPRHGAARVLRAFGTGKGEIVVLNDEAHHCYQDKLLDHPDEEADNEDSERNRDARVWFRGLHDLRRKVGHQDRLRPVRHAVLPEGVRLQRGLHLPLGGQRLLADGRHRVRDREDPPYPGRRRRRGKELVYLHLWDHIQPPLPKRQSAPRRSTSAAAGWVPPEYARRGPAQPLPKLRAQLRRLRDDAGRARRAAAGVDRRLPQHRRLQARVRLDRRPRGRAARRHQTARARATSPLLSNVEDSTWTTGNGRSSSTPNSSNLASRSVPTSGRTPRARSKRSSRRTGCATRAPTSTSSPTPTCCGKR